MANPAQVIFNTPNNDFNVIDSPAAPTFVTPSAGTHIGYDTKSGAVAQGLNSFGDTGTVLLDSVNDTVYADPFCATFKGNPVSQIAPTFTTVATVINNATTGIRILWKNPA